MSDPDRIELTAPLPDNALGAVISFKASKLGRDRGVPRSQASHAELEITGLDGKARSRKVDLAEADAFLREARAVQERDAAWASGRRERQEAARAERSERAAAISLDCPHCGVPRAYEGLRNLMSLGAPDHIARTDDLGRMRPESRGYHEYACGRCGSVEWFRAGTLDHPLPGAS